MHYQKQSAPGEGGDGALMCTGEAALANAKFPSCTRHKKTPMDCREHESIKS